MVIASRATLVLSITAALSTASLFACASKATSSGFAQSDTTPDSGTASDTGGGDPSIDGGPAMSDDSGSFTANDSSYDAPDTTPPPVAIVYAHSASTLYKLDPTTSGVTVVGPFVGCSSVIDLALDQASNAYVTTFSSLYKLDLTTAICTPISNGSYPNSLSFVPKGTLDPNSEALVGYFGAQYVRIDTTTGAVTNIGSLSGGYQSSGDIVSVAGGGTFLTVNGSNCADCLLQVDPKTGDVIQNYGNVNHGSVFGLAFWAGTVYGFDDAGQVFSIAWNNGAIGTTDIPVPNPPAGLEFWGAGSTTAAPAQAPDGGGIPIK